jgi:hypothetical protein
MARRTVRLGRLVRAGTSSGLSSEQWSRCWSAEGRATRTRSQSRRKSEAGAASPGRNIPSNEQRTGCEAIWQTAGDSDKGLMARRTVRSGRLQWSSAVRREDERLGRGLRVEGRVRLGRLDRAGTSSGLSNEHYPVQSGGRTGDSDDVLVAKGGWGWGV